MGKRKQRSSSQPSSYGYTTVASTSTPYPYGAPISSGSSSDRRGFGSAANPIVLDDDDGAPAQGPTPKKAKVIEGYDAVRAGGPSPKKGKKVEGEKRLRQFRPKAPQTFHPVYERALGQRFYVLGRSRCGTPECPEEFVELTGSTGNIYVVHVAQQPSYTCPHSRQGNQCKHVLYVLARVLGARYDPVYQLALLSEELREIFAGAPPILGDEGGAGGAEDPKRKPLDGDCPICFGELGAADSDAIVFCRATCGNNIHRECFSMWAATKRQSPGARDNVTCPMCRSPWQGDDDMVKRIRNTGVVGAEGYVNIANQLGISTMRDMSSYSSFYRPEGYSYGGQRRRGRNYPTWLTGI